MSVRRLLILLLIVTAVVHPLTHIGDDASLCPCVHGAVLLASPLLALVATLVALTIARQTLLFDGDVRLTLPARAPPAVA